VRRAAAASAAAAVVLLAAAPSAPAASSVGTAVHLSTRTQAEALRAGAIGVKLRSRRGGRIKAVASLDGERVTAARTVAVRRGRKGTRVALPLTGAGKRLLRSCERVRVVATARAIGSGAPAATSTRRLSPDTARCGPTPDGDWRQWSFDLSGTRHNPLERTITPATAPRLELKWAFAVPDPDGAQSSQPAVVDGTLYVGGRNGVFYALDARTGKAKWSYNTREVVGPKPPNPGLFPDPSTTTGNNLLRNGPAVVGDLVYFGDFNGNVYALETATGKRRWVTRVDEHPKAILTGSPTYFDGRIYIGVSSNEVFTSSSPTYECCRARGSLVALDAQTGNIDWRFYTVDEPRPAGTNSFGAARYEPSGVSVWSTPAIDPLTDTVYFGTAQNYTGESPLADSFVALDARTGAKRWHNQLTRGDKWTAQCLFPVPGGNCPEPGPDFDFGSSPNLYEAGGRALVGMGQKSGVYHALDARTGAIVWQTILNRASGEGGAGGQEGIQWGTSYDGERLYAATNQGEPGTLFALDPATGREVWKTPNPEDGCTTGGAAASRPGDCTLAMPAAVTTTPGLAYEGGRDGKMRVFDADSGRILWEYDTVRTYADTTNGVSGRGGTISGSGAVVSNGMLYVNSGYQTANSPFTGIAGNVLLAFGLP
jgi:polyvinyl alcohol dehydrogenase (cytochrome)